MLWYTGIYKRRTRPRSSVGGKASTGGEDGTDMLPDVAKLLTFVAKLLTFVASSDEFIL